MGGVGENTRPLDCQPPACDGKNADSTPRPARSPIVRSGTPVPTGVGESPWPEPASIAGLKISRVWDRPGLKIARV